MSLTVSRVPGFHQCGPGMDANRLPKMKATSWREIAISYLTKHFKVVRNVTRYLKKQRMHLNVNRLEHKHLVAKRLLVLSKQANSKNLKSNVERWKLVAYRFYGRSEDRDQNSDED